MFMEYVDCGMQPGLGCSQHVCRSGNQNLRFQTVALGDKSGDEKPEQDYRSQLLSAERSWSPVSGFGCI